MMASALDVNTSVIINAKMTIEFSPWVEPVVQTGRYALLVVQKLMQPENSPGEKKPKHDFV